MQRFSIRCKAHFEPLRHATTALFNRGPQESTLQDSNPYSRFCIDEISTRRGWPTMVLADTLVNGTLATQELRLATNYK